MKRRHFIHIGVLLLATAMLGSCSAPEKGGRWSKSDYHLSYGLPFLDRQTMRNPLKPKGGDSLSGIRL